MGYSVELLMLPRGWFGFVFKSPEDSTKILGFRRRQPYAQTLEA
jgi:hypothetical protein